MFLNTLILQDQPPLAGFRVPNSGSIAPVCNDEFAIWRQNGAATMQPAKLLAALCVPDSCGVVIRRSYDARTVSGKDRAVNSILVPFQRSKFSAMRCIPDSWLGGPGD